MEIVKEERINIIILNAKTVSAVLSAPADASAVRTAVILTHGAGGDMNFKALVSLSHALASNGLLCLRFTCKSLNLAHRVKVYRVVWEYLKDLERFTIRNIFFAGRSMGARAATALARQLTAVSEDAIQGLVCLSFPLHPPGQRDNHRQRSEDLRGLPKELPVLFLSGTADNMCEKILLENVIKEMKSQATVYWIKGGCHGLTVKGRDDESVMDDVNSYVISWIVEHT